MFRELPAQYRSAASDGGISGAEARFGLRSLSEAMEID